VLALDPSTVGTETAVFVLCNIVCHFIDEFLGSVTLNVKKDRVLFNQIASLP